MRRQVAAALSLLGRAITPRARTRGLLRVPPEGQFAHFMTNGGLCAHADESFRRGYAAGVSDAISAFASVAAEHGAIPAADLLGLVYRVHSKGHHVSELTSWAVSVWETAPPGDPAAATIMKRCAP